MGKNKMIAKSCPKCEMQVAVASKSCKCGHTFFASRRAIDALPAVENIQRRTGRVTRSQPQFYDSQQYQKQKPKVTQKSSKKHSLSSSCERECKTKKGESETVRTRKRRGLKRAREVGAGLARSGGDKPRELTPQLRPAQQARCSLILHEINRKMAAVTWQPPPE